MTFVSTTTGNRWWTQGGLAAVMAMTLALVTSCSQQPDSAPQVLAVVDGQPVTVLDFDQEVQRRQALKQTIPGKEALLEEMVTYQALLARAKKAGLTEDPKVMREINNLLIGKLKDSEMSERLRNIEVTEEELKEEYESRIKTYTLPAKVRMAVLFLKAGANSSEAKRRETRSRLEEARDKVMTRSSVIQSTSGIPGFGDMARVYSDDQASRYRSGDIGWLEADRYDYRWPKGVLEQGNRQSVGELSPVLETEQGYYLVLTTDHRPGSVRTLDEVSTGLAQSLKLRKRSEIQQAFHQESIVQSGAIFHREALAAIKWPPAPVAGLLARSNNNKELPVMPAEASTIQKEMSR